MPEKAAMYDMVPPLEDALHAWPHNISTTCNAWTHCMCAMRIGYNVPCVALPLPNQKPSPGWACKLCTFENPSGAVKCTMCGASPQAAPVPQVASIAPARVSPHSPVPVVVPAPAQGVGNNTPILYPRAFYLIVLAQHGHATVTHNNTRRHTANHSNRP